MVQNFAFAYAIIVDTREKPSFPKKLAFINILMPIIFSMASGAHTVYSGPFAWDGVITFYMIGFTFLVQVCADALYLALAAREEGQMERLEKNSLSSGANQSASV
jgi:hypothetical protein